MKETKIIKVKNPDGEWSKCSICGHEIKHIYILAGATDVPENHLGAECIKHFGASKKDLKIADVRRENYEKRVKLGNLAGCSETEWLMGYVR